MKHPLFRPQQIERIDETRRTFLTVGITAIAVFVASRFVDTNKWFQKEKILSEATFEHFDIVETTDEIRLSERGGEPIFIVDKASFRQ